MVVVVDGEAGIGKTSLLRAALVDSPALVIWASGDEAESDIDHGIIEQLVRAAPLPDPARKELQSTLGTDPLRTGAALVALVDSLELDPARPLVVVVDDAQWADPPSLRALTFAARRLRRDPVVLVVAVRTDGAHRVPAGLLRLADAEGARIHLEPLTRDDVRRLAEDRTGTAVSITAADRLRAHTGGSPLHLVTLLEELPDGALAAPGELPSPRSFSTLVLSRLVGCDRSVEALVMSVAVLGGAPPVATAAAVAELEDPLPALDDATTRGLLFTATAADGRVTVSVAHPLVRAALLGDLPPGRRAELHRRAAAVVGGSAGLRHRLQGALGPDAPLWQEAMGAAAAEVAQGAHGAASAMLRQAARVAPTTEDRERSILDAADQLLLAGQLDEARSLRPAVDSAAPSARRSYVRGRFAYVVGPRRETRPLLGEAWTAILESAGGEAGLARLVGDERRLAGQVAAMRAVSCVDRADGDEAARWCRWALELAPPEAALASTAHMLAGAHALLGRLDVGLDELDHLVRTVVDAGDAAVADAHCGRGLLRLWSHDLVGAGEDLERSLASATRGASFAARESARFYLAEVRYRQGRWDDAVLLAQTAASVADDSDQAWMAALPHATAARPLAARGEAAARDHLESALAATAAVGRGVGIVLTKVSALEVAACDRDHVRVTELARALQGAGIDERIAPWRASAVEALVAESHLEEAAALVAELGDGATTPLVISDTARATVTLAAARGEHSAVDLAAETGLSLDPDLVGLYPRARLELAAGRAWRRRGDRRRSVAVLEQARARFDALGARPWIDQVDREIAASGLRPARRAVAPGTDLTPQEQAVAQLVARGLTNREVGAELVVSAKTVEHHLSRIYTKLGIRGRTELARLLATPDR